MLELNSKKLKLTFNSKVYELRYPTVKDLKEYNELVKKGDHTEMDLIVSMLDGVGLSKNVTDTMEIGHLNAIVEELIVAKK